MKSLLKPSHGAIVEVYGRSENFYCQRRLCNNLGQAKRRPLLREVCGGSHPQSAFGSSRECY